MAEKKIKPKCEVTLILKDRRFTGKGVNTLSALKRLKEPKDIKSIANFETVVDGKLAKFPLRLNPTKLKRLFANEWEMELLAKRLDTLR